ncbi:hypothetical protein V2W45_1499070 [Cenococcum geophilum]
MDRYISKLKWNNYIDQPISFKRRVRVALKDGAIKDSLLEKKKSRKIFKQIRDDLSSLAMLYDSASFITSLTTVTETSSKLLLKFRFDGELLRSKIYQGTVRSLLRRAIHGSNGPKVISESAKSFSQPDRPIRDTSVARLTRMEKLSTIIVWSYKTLPLTRPAG